MNKRIIRKIGILMLVVCVLLGTSIVKSTTIVEAKATKKAMKFLKGTWATTHHPCEKVVFTKKYMKVYAGYDKNRNEYKGKKKGKLLWKAKIVSTKKKKKEWTIKVKTGNSIIFYKGFRDGLTCQWKENGEWMYSFSDSLSRI